MNKGGRPSKYDTDVKPRFEEIREWLKLGATDKEIADNLGINKATICDYKKRFPEFDQLLKNGRKAPIQAIKAALFRRACGYDYKEMIVTDSEKDGKKTQIYTKHVVPDPTAALILLKHWDKETEWTQDPATLKLKKQELELKKKQVEQNNW